MEYDDCLIKCFEEDKHTSSNFDINLFALLVVAF